MSKFKCTEENCKHEIELSHFCTVIRDGEARYKKDKYTSDVICCDIHQDKPLVKVEEEFKGWPTANLAFASMNAAERTKFLDKRAKEHFKKHGIEEKNEKLKASGLSIQK